MRNLAFDSLQWLICHKTQPNQTKPNQTIKAIYYKNFHYIYMYVTATQQKQYIIAIAQSAGAVEYTDCTFSEG